MQKNKLIIIFMISALIFLLAQSPSMSIEVGMCKECHEVVEPIPSSSILKNCFACHGNHNSGSPGARDPKTVHGIHENTIRNKRSESCGGSCHQNPVVCTKCHPSHKSSINITSANTDLQNDTLNNTTLQRKNDTVVQRKNVSNCNDCHGKLPQPLGHENFLEALSESKHKWMNCDTCHANVFNRTDPEDYEFKLRFKNLFFVPIDNSSQICKICHSSQYEGSKEGIHGAKNKKCVDCHSPHTTRLIGTKFITPRPTPVNISSKVESTTEWITKKVPILGNPLVLFIIFIVILVTISEYILSRTDEGTKVAYNTVKIAAKEDNLKTLDIRLKDQNINTVGEMLEKDGINILGMTMIKEKEKDTSADIYKYIIFINVERPIDEKGEKELVSKILSIDNVKSVSFTDKYEL